MIENLVNLLISFHLMSSMDLVFGDILCKDSRIDSMTYANDVQMYFFTSGGYYWWLKENEFPPSDNKAKRLPSPFVIGQAAVYVDSDSGCASDVTEGIKPGDGIKFGEKEVWVEEYVGGAHQLMAFDTKKGVWRDQTVVYNKDHCISRARIDWATGKSLDAMFVRNYLEIYFVQNNTYAMVDCHFICKDPTIFGDDKSVYKTKDFQTVDPIYAMFVKKNKELFVFHLKTYYQLTIQPNSRDGKLVTIKSTEEKQIIKDFMKITDAGQCIQTTTPPALPSLSPQDNQNIPEGGVEKNPQPVGGSENKSNDVSKRNGLSLIIVVVIVLAIIAIIGGMSFFVIRSKSNQDIKSEKEKAEKAEKPKTSAVSPKPQQIKASVPSKGVSNKPQPSLNQSSTIAIKSNLEVVGIASKTPKSSKVSKKK